MKNVGWHKHRGKAAVIIYRLGEEGRRILVCDMVFRGRGGGQLSPKEFKGGTLENWFLSIQGSGGIGGFWLITGFSGGEEGGSCRQKSKKGRLQKIDSRQYRGGGGGGRKILVYHIVFMGRGRGSLFGKRKQRGVHAHFPNSIRNTEQYTDVYTTSFDVSRVWECFTLAINSRLIIIHD